MKKLFLILAAAAFMVACAPKSQPVESVTDVEEIEVVDDAIVEPETPAQPATQKPATPKPTTPKEEPKEEPKEQPKEEPKEQPKADEPKTNQVKGKR
jgi:outer membrane biosynthesis protein TonB